MTSTPNSAKWESAGSRVSLSGKEFEANKQTVAAGADPEPAQSGLVRRRTAALHPGDALRRVADGHRCRTHARALRVQPWETVGGCGAEGRGEPSPSADVGGVSPDAVQLEKGGRWWWVGGCVCVWGGGVCMAVSHRMLHAECCKERARWNIHDGLSDL
jgi:hypothetical protein